MFAVFIATTLSHHLCSHIKAPWEASKDMQRFKWLLISIPSTYIIALLICFQGTLLCFALTVEHEMINNDNESLNRKEKIFALVSKLENNLPFTRESVEKILGLTLTVDTDKSNDYKICSHTEQHCRSFIKAISVTEPMAKTANLMNYSGTVVIDIDDIHQKISIKDIRHQFGKESYIICHPVDPLKSNIVAPGYVYLRPWGRLEFQVEPNNFKNLTKISLESVQIANRFEIASKPVFSNDFKHANNHR